MKCKLDFRSSSAIIKENIKMYWYIPLLMFISLFLCGPFTLLFNNNDYKEEFLNNFLNCKSVGQTFFYGLFTLISAITFMNYLHKSKRSLMIHSRPFTRRRIFNSNVLSGLIMLILPVVFTGISYLLISHTSIMYDLTDILSYIIKSTSIIVFLYSTFILAGVLTGSSIIQLILCAFINLFIPATIAVVEFWKTGFLEGYNGISHNMEMFLYNLSPYIRMFKYKFSIPNALIYLGIGLLIILVSNILIGFIKLEKTNDMLFFKIVEEIITYLICFYGMSFFGFLFAFVMDNEHIKLVLFIGMIFGILISFFITKVILNKSVKIFNKQNLKSLVIFIIIAIIFSLFTVFDITGYSYKMPNENKIESVTLNEMIFNYPGDTLGTQDLVFTDEEIISNVYKLNKEITKRDHDDDKTFNSNFDITSERCLFNYNIKGGDNFMRNYDIVIKKNDKIVPYIEAIISSPEYKERFILNDEYSKSIKDIKLYLAKVVDYNDSIYNDAYVETDGKVILSRSEIETFVDSYNKDINELQYSNYLSYIQHNNDDFNECVCYAVIEHYNSETEYYYVKKYSTNLASFASSFYFK